MATAIKVEGLGKRFLLGQTFENTLSSRVGDLFRGRGLGRRAAPPEEFWALRDVSFDIAQGEAVGIIGGNGAGKSTLLKILSRITPPTLGRASVRGRLSSLLEVGTGFHPELTGRENVFLNGAILGMRKAEVERKFDEIVAFSGVEKFIDTPVKRYSSGMYVRLAFAVAAHLEPDVLIIDEVLAVGDADFQKRCLGKMNDVASEGRTVIFVSHNMAAVQKLCSKAIWMQGGCVRQIGDSESVIHSYLDDVSTEIDGVVEIQQGAAYARRFDAGSDGPGVVTRVRLLVDGAPVSQVRTWQDLVFEIEFSVASAYRSLAVEMAISTLDGVPLIVTSTTPDHSIAFGVEPGRYRVHCHAPKLALAAGEYVVSLRLAVPWVEYIWQSENAFRLHVEAVDVFNSGFPPMAKRCLVVQPHAWGAPVRLEVSASVDDGSS